VTYTLLKYNRAIKVSLSGAPVVLPADAVNDICLLLDVCSSGGCSGGGGVAFMLSLPGSIIEPLAGDGLLQGFKANGLTIDAARIALGGQLEVVSRTVLHCAAPCCRGAACVRPAIGPDPV